MLVTSLDDISKSNLLPYGLSSSSAVITLLDSDLIKSERGTAASNFFKEKIRQINTEYDRLILLAKHTDLVYNSHYNFIPKVGKIYHLYYTGSQYILSMIEPYRWDKFKFVASYRFTSDNTWEMQDGQEEATDTTE